MYNHPLGFVNWARLSDSYKPSHWRQYPSGAQFIHSYWESRGGLFPEITWFGLQYLLKAYLMQPLTHEMVEEADEAWGRHLGPGVFNRKGFMRIVNMHDGLPPLKIRSVPEGMTIPTRNVMMTVQNTDPELPWLTNWWETILCQVWAPTTTATLSREIKKVIGGYLEKTGGDMDSLPFKLHDFGFRGVSSVETAGLLGLAHLVNFMGTDTAIALDFANQYYHEPNAGFSIPAAEHSTITSWGGPEKEIDAFRNMIKQYGGHGGDGTGHYAVVSDSWDFFEACKVWSSDLIEEVRNAPNMLVVRPDSGTPHVIVVQGLETLDSNERGGFGHTVNFKGYKTLDGVRMIQGDGVNLPEIIRILEAMTIRKWSTDNIAFGMGGALLQKLNRDTQECAFKASYIEGRIPGHDGYERDVFKRPTTDHAKKSKGGKLRLVLNDDGTPETVSGNHWNDREDILQIVFENGELLVDHTLAEIRERAAVTEFAQV